jgi:RimJ/RimL family protein N-acetyltransferase
MDATFSLRTARIILRQWHEADLVPFAALNADPVAMEHFPSTLSREESDALAGRLRAAIEEHGFGLWAVEVPGVAEFVGFLGLSIQRFEAPFTSCVEIGWRLDRACWGRGLATEGARAAMNDGFERLGLSEIVSFTAEENTRSRRVMEKLGMHHAPEDDFDHPRVAEGHRLRRHVLYRLRREEWLGAGRGGG